LNNTSENIPQGTPQFKHFVKRKDYTLKVVQNAHVKQKSAMRAWLLLKSRAFFLRLHVYV